MGWIGALLGIKKYQHNGYARYLSLNQGPIHLPFTAEATQITDSIRVRLENAGNVPTVVTIRFVDALSGRQVGNAKRQGLTAGQAATTYAYSGMAAGLSRARKYRLEFIPSAPDLNSYTAPQQTTVTYTRTLKVSGFAVGAIPSQWRIPYYSDCIPMGGTEGYQSAGVAYRTLDVGEVPTLDGTLTFNDVVPAGTALVLTAYYTDDPVKYAAAGIGGWSVYGAIVSGTTIPPARYWRFKIDFTSNTTNDRTPSIEALSITYFNDPLVFGTASQRLVVDGFVNAYDAQSIKALDSVSASSSSLSSIAKRIMVGRLTLTLAPEQLVESLFGRPMRGRKVMIRAGYSDVADTMLYYQGLVRDMAYSHNGYSLTIQDPIELADIAVPRQRHATWNGGTAYTGGQIVSYDDKSYLCLVDNTGQQPDTSPTYWQDNGTVWIDIVYPAGTHLCDIFSDLLANQINLPSEYIDAASIAVVKAALPTRTIAKTRTISRPEQALGMLGDIAWLLESYVTIREGRFALLQEPTTANTPVEYIDTHDIANNSVQYRRGWAEMKNECIILTSYSQNGSSDSDQFGDGVIVADATSILDYHMSALHEFKDKWNLSQSELTTIATNFVNRWKNGRRILKFKTTMRLLPVEAGDVVNIVSGQLPFGDISQMDGIVMKKDIDWQDQTLTFTILEVT